MRNKSFLRKRVEGGHLHRVLQVLSDVMNHVRNVALFLEKFLEDRSFKWTEWTSYLGFVFPNYKSLCLSNNQVPSAVTKSCFFCDTFPSVLGLMSLVCSIVTKASLKIICKIFPEGSVRNAIVEVVVPAFALLTNLGKTVPNKRIDVLELRVLQQVGLLHNVVWELHERVHRIDSG